MEPLLKWAGGKRSIATELVMRFPRDWKSGRYFEPFLGGGAVFFSVAPHNAFVSDVNERLINFYNSLKSDPEGLEQSISAIGHSFDSLDMTEKRRRYLELRNEMNRGPNLGKEKAAVFFAVNKLCFNGVYRENKLGMFNVPFGNHSRVPRIDSQQWTQAHGLLSKTEVKCAPYTDALASAKASDFVFLDPPYIALSDTAKFTAYSKADFGLRDQILLERTMRSLTERGVRVMMTNSDTDLTIRIFRRFRREQISVRRAVSAKSTGRGFAPELIFTNYEKDSGKVMPVTWVRVTPPVTY